MPQATKQLLSHMVLFSPLTVLFSPLTALWDVLLVDYHREIRRDSKPAVPVSVSCCRAMMLSTRVFNLEGGILLCTDSRSDKACISVPRQYQLDRLQSFLVLICQTYPAQVSGALGFQED